MQKICGNLGKKCFLGASGKSVKIVCRGELFPNETTEGHPLPQKEEEIQQFHLNLYQTARRAYMNQFGFDIEYLEPRLDRTVYVSADPEMGFNPKARPFYAVTLQEDYMKKHKIKPLQAIPNDTLQMMKTEIFLNANFEMRKLLLDERCHPEVSLQSVVLADSLAPGIRECHRLMMLQVIKHHH